jgi:hypothetical protein
LSEFASKVGFSRATLYMPTESHRPLIVISYAHADEPERPAEDEVTRAKELHAAASAAYHAARYDAGARAWPAGDDRDAILAALAAAALTASAVEKHASNAASIAASAVGEAANATRAVGAARRHEVARDALLSPKAPGDRAAAEAYANRTADAYESHVNLSERSIFWREIRADLQAALDADSDWLADLPLGSAVAPDWARDALRDGLRADEDWDVWTSWYEERLRGGSRGEAREFVLASVPTNEWDKGPAAANAWIRAHMPET